MRERERGKGKKVILIKSFLVRCALKECTQKVIVRFLLVSDSDSVNIPSVFVGYADGMDLALHYNYTRRFVLLLCLAASVETVLSVFVCQLRRK